MSKSKKQNKNDHHKKHQAKKHAKVYWPYIPLMLVLLGGMFLSLLQPIQRHQSATLAYSTEMSRSGLLSSTNSVRGDSGAGALSLNDKLNAAAQAKANDMVARDYWSHNTPEGKEPWIFIDGQGYDYTKAGENLAYGFSTSSSTITGWMNSPSHKANMLDGGFQEAGFGFANSANFVGSGEQTVVVAMYATPVNPAPAPAAAAPAPVAAKPSSQKVAQASTKPAPAAAPVETPAPSEPVETQPVETTSSEAPAEETKEDIESIPVNTEIPNSTLQTTSERITLLQQLTNGRAPWATYALSLFGFTLSTVWLIKHAISVKRFISEGEYFIAHHPILDLVVVTVVFVILYLGQSTGIIL